MLALTIILGVLLFLFLLTLFPLRVDVSFREEFSLTLRYLFLRFPLSPGGEKPEKKEKPPKEETEGESASHKLKTIVRRKGFSGFLESLFELVKLVLSAGKKTLSHIKLERFDLYLCLGGGEDAADAAIRYGRISGAVYSACGVLFGLLPCKKEAVTVDLDYQAPENTVDFSAAVSIRPLYILKEGVSLLIKGLPVLLGLVRADGPKKPEKKGEINERKQSE